MPDVYSFDEFVSKRHFVPNLFDFFAEKDMADSPGYTYPADCFIRQEGQTLWIDVAGVPSISFPIADLTRAEWFLFGLACENEWITARTSDAKELAYWRGDSDRFKKAVTIIVNDFDFEDLNEDPEGYTRFSDILDLSSVAVLAEMTGLLREEVAEDVHAARAEAFREWEEEMV
jgi:hypothetical protein